MFEREILEKIHSDNRQYVKRVDETLLYNKLLYSLRFIIISSLFLLDLFFTLLIFRSNLNLILYLQVVFFLIYFLSLYTPLFNKILKSYKKLYLKLKSRFLGNNYFFVDFLYSIIILAFIIGTIIYCIYRFSDSIQLELVESNIITNVTSFITNTSGLIITFLIFIMGNNLNKYPNTIAHFIYTSYRVLAPISLCVISILFNLILMIDSSFKVDEVYSIFTAFIVVFSLVFIIYITFSSNETERIIEYCGYKGAHKINKLAQLDSDKSRKIKMLLISKGLFFLPFRKNSSMSLSILNQHKILKILEAFIQLSRSSLKKGEIEIFKISLRNLCKASKDYLIIRRQYAIYKDPILDYLLNSLRVLFDDVKKQKNEFLYNEFITTVSFYISNSISLALKNKISSETKSKYNYLTPEWLTFSTEIYSYCINLQNSTSASESIDCLFGNLLTSIHFDDEERILYTYPEMINIWSSLLVKSPNQYHFILISSFFPKILDNLAYAILKNKYQKQLLDILDSTIEIYKPYDSFLTFNIENIITHLFTPDVGSDQTLISIYQLLINDKISIKNHDYFGFCDQVLNITYKIFIRNFHTYKEKDIYSAYYCYYFASIITEDERSNVLVGILDKYILLGIKQIDLSKIQITDILFYIIIICLKLIKGYDKVTKGFIEGFYLNVLKSTNTTNFKLYISNLQIIYYVLKNQKCDQKLEKRIGVFLKQNYNYKTTTSILSFQDSYEKLNLPNVDHYSTFTLPYFEKYRLQNIPDCMWEKYISYRAEFDSFKIVASLYELYELDLSTIRIRHR